MGEHTTIAWTDHTFNAWIGCEKISPGCKHCYAEVGTYARVSASRGLPLWGPSSSRHVTSNANWRDPLAWSRAAVRDGVRRRVFCSSLSDVFEDREELLAPRARLAQLITKTSVGLDWLLLTKRPENADRLWRQAWSEMSDTGAEFLRAQISDPWLPNVWLGTTCEDQERADKRIPHLLQTGAHVRFLSCEPLLGPVDLSRWLDRWTCECGWSGREGEGLLGDKWCPACAAANPEPAPSVDWVIVGGESGPKARPLDVRWARGIVRQCREANAACFVKQMGSVPWEVLPATGGVPTVYRDVHPDRIWPGKVPGEVGDRFEVRHPQPQLRHPKGGDWDEWPKSLDDLRVRQFPEVRS